MNKASEVVIIRHFAPRQGTIYKYKFMTLTLQLSAPNIHTWSEIFHHHPCRVSLDSNNFVHFLPVWFHYIECWDVSGLADIQAQSEAFTYLYSVGDGATQFECQTDIMMTSSNGSIFRVTGPLCGDRWIPCTKANEAELWCFLWFAP